MSANGPKNVNVEGMMKTGFEESGGRLYVGEWNRLGCVLVFNNVYNVDTLFK